MLRAGMIRKLTSGVYDLLPAGYRVLQKIETIVREEMNRVGCQEILMPILHPDELYEETGRLKNFGPLLFMLRDRRDRRFALGPTHEEVVTEIARGTMRSYRQLPQCLYQMNTKFRDEFRPRFGMMRAREFVMKDAYSFHATRESLRDTYEEMGEAYHRILARCGLEAVRVEADAGAIGGDVNHEFVVLADAGESQIFRCGSCDYAANDERAISLGTRRVTDPVGDAPVRVDTPSHARVEDVASFLGVKPEALVKTLLVRSQGRVFAVLIPGERQLSVIKLGRALSDPAVEMLDDEEVESITGARVGFAGPIGLPGSVETIADALLDSYDGMIVGANESDVHLRGVKMGRDFHPARTESISVALDGDRCSACADGFLAMSRGVELGHIFDLGTRYSERMGATFLDSDGEEKPFIMGCYGFGVSRAVAAAIEQHHDDRGIRWPKPITPFEVIVMPINASDEGLMTVANQIYVSLADEGWDVLLDDRDLRPGPKFKDAELIGVPLRITIGARNIANNQVEMYDRLSDTTRLLDVDAIAGEVAAYYRTS